MTTRLLSCMLWLALAAPAAGCSVRVTGPDPVDSLVVSRLRPEPLPFTFNSGMTTSERLVIRDNAAWASAWQRIWRGHLPVPPLPSVDFDAEIIILVSLGPRATGGFTILIDSAGVFGSEIVIRVRSTAPDSGCGVTLALTQPVDIARVTRREGTIRFEEERETRACR